MDNKQTTTMTPIDSQLFESLDGMCASTAEKDFFVRMKYKIEYEPAMANDLIMSEHDNEDGIYIVRCYDYEFIIGCHVGDVFKEEQYAMNFSSALALNLKDCGFIEDNLTLLDWLRKRDFKGIQYDHNFDLI